MIELTLSLQRNQEERVAEFLNEYFLGVPVKVTDAEGGEEITDAAALKAALIRDPVYRTALYKRYADFMNGADQEKNSETPLSSFIGGSGGRAKRYDELKRQGAPREVLAHYAPQASDTVVVQPMDWPAVQLFLRIQTQWVEHQVTVNSPRGVVHQLRRKGSQLPVA